MPPLERYSLRLVLISETVKQEDGDEASRQICMYSILAQCRRVPQEGHMATAEQMALVALQYCFSPVAHCRSFLMTTCLCECTPLCLLVIEVQHILHISVVHVIF